MALPSESSSRGAQVGYMRCILFVSSRPNPATRKAKIYVNLMAPPERVPRGLTHPVKKLPLRFLLAQLEVVAGSTSAYFAFKSFFTYHLGGLTAHVDYCGVCKILCHT